MGNRLRATQQQEAGSQEVDSQEMANTAEKLTGAGLVNKAAKAMSTRGTKSRMDAMEDEALGPTVRKPK